jgi:asparagine synthase (glutamine-hydrolysing)
MGSLPPWLLRTLSRSISRVPMSMWEGLGRLARPVPAVRRRGDGFGYRMLRLADRLECETPQRLYRHLMSYWSSPVTLVVDGGEPATVLASATGRANLDQYAEEMMLLDTLTYLPDDILVKVDRASMAVALEVRAPLLDHRVLEFAWQLPLALKLHGGQGKLLLRRVLGRYVPERLFERPKAGFAVPIYRWLRGPLRDWAEGLLDEARIRREGFLDPQPIRQVWQALLRGHTEWAYGGELIWGILMFQAWLESTLQAEPRSCDGTEHGIMTARSAASA